MLKIDSHQHFWQLDRFHYPWLGPDLAVLYRDYLPADLAPHLHECGVSATVAVQATHAVAEAEWLLDLARDSHFLRGVVGWVDITAPDVGAQLDRLRAQGPLCGVRHQVHDEPDSAWLLREEVVAGLRAIAERGLPYDLLLRPVHLAVIPRLLDAVPDMRWVVDHLAKPYIARGELQPWADEMRPIAAHPGVVCKVSGMVTEADHARWTPADFRPYFDTVLELFGPQRLMFGSDWPVCLLAASYVQVHDLAAELVAGLSPTEKAAIWGETARAVYRLDVAATPG